MVPLLLATLLLQDPPAVRLPESFSHPFFSFKVRMPAGWGRGPNHGKADASFYGPKAEGYIPRVDLYIKLTDAGLAKYVETLKATFRAQYADVEFLSDDVSKVRDRDAHFFTLKFTDGGIAMKTTWMAVGAPGRLYTLGWSCTEAAAGRYAAGIEALMRSIRLHELPKAAKEQKEEFARTYAEAEKEYKAGRHAEAVKKFRRCAELLPEYPEIHATLGTACIRSRNFSDAETAFRRAIELDPDDHDHYANYGSVLLQQGKLDPAIEALRKAVKAEPHLHQAWSNLGLALMDKNDYPGAVAAFESAVKAEPDSATNHYNLGTALEQWGKKDLALARFKEALKADPNHLLSKEAVKRLAKQ